MCKNSLILAQRLDQIRKPVFQNEVRERFEGTFGLKKLLVLIALGFLLFSNGCSLKNLGSGKAEVD